MYSQIKSQIFEAKKPKINSTYFLTDPNTKKQQHLLKWNSWLYPNRIFEEKLYRRADAGHITPEWYEEVSSYLHLTEDTEDISAGFIYPIIPDPKNNICREIVDGGIIFCSGRDYIIQYFPDKTILIELHESASPFGYYRMDPNEKLPKVLSQMHINIKKTGYRYNDRV